MLPTMRLYEDELVSSALIRCCRTFRLPFKQLARDVLGKSGLRSVFFSASRLDAIAPLFGISAERLLWNHTTFPYATAFASKATYESARLAALGHAAVAPLLATMQNASDTVRFRRVCTLCLREDFEQYGESYWHRAHNLPGVLSCLRHGCGLSTTPIAAIGELRTLYELPHECKRSGRRAPASSDSMASVELLSVQILSRHQSPGESRGADWYRDLAVQHGWLSAGRQADQERLEQVVRSAYPSGYLRAIGLSDMTWTSLAFRAGIRFTLSPLKHLLLEAALRARSPERPGELDHVSSGPPGTHAADLDRFYAPRARTELSRAVASGQKRRPKHS
jgi:hypothetical protein